MIPNLIMNKNLTKNKKGVFSCELVFDFYDHFGLDSGDLISFDNTPLRTGVSRLVYITTFQWK